MKKDENIEKLLLSNSNYEKAVKTHLENEFKQILNNKTKVNFITDIKSVPQNKLFTKSATFEVINKISKTKTYINGLQAEGYLGSQASDRQKLLSGETDSFVNGDCFVKFLKIKI